MISRQIHWLPLLLVLAIAATFTQVTAYPMDDHFQYQAFVEALAGGALDLSIPGFHGSDILAVIVHWITGSSISQIYFQILAAILLPLCAYGTSRALYQSKEEQILFTTAVSLMPFVLFVGLRGWTGAAYWDLMLLSIATAPFWPYVAAVLLALAILTKPFAVALLPLLFVLQPKTTYRKLKWYPLYLCIGLCTLYVIVQYFQAGQILIGSHSELDQISVWQGPNRIFLNLAHSLQILFSVHNYYYPDPSLTGAGNMMHTTPVLIFLGLFALFTGVWEKPFRKALVGGVGVGIGLNALLDHMDHYYMEAGILCLIIAAIPLLKTHRIWVPIALATLHFQWLYFFLEFETVFSLSYTFFIVPALIDTLFIVYLLLKKKEVCATLREIL